MQVDRRLIEQIVDEFFQAPGSLRMARLIMKLEDALNTRDLLLTVTPAQMAHAAAVEPCNKSCAPGYCYCEPIIQSKIKEDSWQSLTDKERDYFKACGFVGVSRVEEVLRAKNSTLACIPAVPPGLEDIEGKKGL